MPLSAGPAADNSPGWDDGAKITRLRPAVVGVPLQMYSQAFLPEIARASHPLMPFREAIENGLEADATSIVVTITSSKSGRIEDNGRGMLKSELLQYMGGLGASSKLIHSEGNLGIGLKMLAIVHQLDISITSGVSEQHAHRVALGKVSEKDIGLLHMNRQGDLIVPTAPRYLPGESRGTAVEISGITKDFSRNDLVRFLNSRYLNLELAGKSVVVTEEGSSREPTRILGVLPRLITQCAPFGRVELDYSTVYWGIRKNPPFAGERGDGRLDSYYFGWGDELAYSQSFHSGGETKLRNLGIRFGGRDVVLVQIAKKTPDCPLNWTATRSSIEGWDKCEHLAAQEWRYSIPDEIEEHMARFESATTLPPTEAAEVHALLEKVNAPYTKLEIRRPSAPKNREENQTSDRRENQGRRESELDRVERDPRESSNTREGRSLARPKHQFFEDPEAMAANSSGTVININAAAPHIKTLLDADITEKQKVRVRALIAAQLISAYVKYSRANDGVRPLDSQLSEWTYSLFAAENYVADCLEAKSKSKKEHH